MRRTHIGRSVRGLVTYRHLAWLGDTRRGHRLVADGHIRSSMSEVDLRPWRTRLCHWRLVRGQLGDM
jgi:hypothetical protein